MQTFASQRVFNLNNLFAVFVSITALIAMAESAGEGTSSAKVHIVYTEKPTNEEPEAYHLHTLSSALGSEQAAKEALVYSYKNAASGFAAKLTPEQVTEMSKQPGVIQVVPSQTYKLHNTPGGGAAAGGGGGGFSLH